MSKKEIRLQRENRELKAALGRFAEVPVSEEGDVWFYIGVKEPSGYNAPPLHTDDFIRAQELA